jgi:MFS family permease
MTDAEADPAQPRVAGRGTWLCQSSLRRPLAVLCVTQLTSFGVLYYAFLAILPNLTAETGWPTGMATAAFSTGLVVSAVVGMQTGRLLDRHGPRPVMTAGSVLCVGALLAVAAAPSLPWFFAAWVLTGLAQSAVLYPAAFSALTRWYGPRRVSAITTLSLVAGLASTVFAPLTAALAAHLDWRAVYVVLAALFGMVTIPLHAWGLTPVWPAEQRHQEPRDITGHVGAVLRSGRFVILAVAMALAAFGMYAAVSNLVPLLVAKGTDTTLAAVALGMAGVGQFLGRLCYPGLARRTSHRTRTAAVLAAGAVTVALIAGTSHVFVALSIAAILAGAVRGIYTLVQATAVSDRWGTRRFPTLHGIFSAPATIAIAMAPVGGAWLAGWFGSYSTAFYAMAVFTLTGAAIATCT